MKRKDLSEYKKKYQTFKHHAWAGLGFLSVLLAIRLLTNDFEILTPIIGILLVYIVVALIFTYRYSAGLSAEEAVTHVQPSTDIELEKEKLKAKLEKKRLKIEKKKAKAEIKKAKKAKK